MCAIAGILNVDGKPVAAADLSRMTQVMAYRGPDGQGVCVNRHVGLGHRRLAIIDLSPAGHQPMSNEDGTVWVVFNGEVYNYLELIPILQEKGSRFKSHTDTEVVLHSYEEWGEDCVRYVVSIKIGPCFDPLEKIERMPYDLHSQLYEFSIEADVTCPVDLGLVRQGVSWTLHKR